MPLESPDWYEAERQPDQIARRRVQLKRKIARLSLPHDHLLQGPTLDVACGCGEALDLFHMRGHRRLVGLDLHDQPLDGFPGRYAYLRASAAALPFPDSSLQLVCCFHALHHLADEAEIGRFLLEAERILRPGGYLALIDFHAGFV